MTARLADIADLPGWPRGLSEEQAAAYVGVSVTTFRWEVEQGIHPPAECRGPSGTRKVWDRDALDAKWDQRTKQRPILAGLSEDEAIAGLD